MTTQTYEDLLAEGKTMDGLLQSKEGILEVIGAFQNSFKTKSVYIQPNDLINELVAEGKLFMEIVSGLKCYGLMGVENGND